MTVLHAENLGICFHGEEHRVYAVQDFNITLNRGETIGIVGESGCGKSTAAMALMGLLPASAEISHGTVHYEDQCIIAPNIAYPKNLRGRRMGMIFQDPMTCLNPFLTIADQFAMPLQRHLTLSKSACRQRSIELLTQVGIPDPAARLKRFPHEFSGGQRQRLMIALALSCDPEVLIADEPTTALDVTVQAQILRLLKKLQNERGLGLVLITHDLGVVAQVCDSVIVMYAGRCVERGSCESLFATPSHPYTKALLASMPDLNSEPGSVLNTIGGQPPRMIQPDGACAFAPRCPLAQPLCHKQRPALEALPASAGNDHHASCHALNHGFEQGNGDNT